jgi:hypothetical protein
LPGFFFSLAAAFAFADAFFAAAAALVIFTDVVITSFSGLWCMPQGYSLYFGI